MVANFILRTEFVLFLVVLKSCLAHRLRQLTRDPNSDVRTLNLEVTSLMHYHEKHQMMFIVGLTRRKVSKIKEMMNNI